MDPATLGSLGGLVGAAIGILGGALGTYVSIRNTQGPKERAFVIKASVICWILVVTFVATVLLLPSPHRYIVWLPYAVVLLVAIRLWNKGQSSIRREESAKRAGVS